MTQRCCCCRSIVTTGKSLERKLRLLKGNSCKRRHEFGCFSVARLPQMRKASSSCSLAAREKQRRWRHTRLAMLASSETSAVSQPHQRIHDGTTSHAWPESHSGHCDASGGTRKSRRDKKLPFTFYHHSWAVFSNIPLHHASNMKAS